MEMEITFGEGKRVNASYKGMTIMTDQSVKAGGDASAPEPFTLFLASIGTCAGIYVKSFCDNRKIPSEKIKLVQKMRVDPVKKLIDRIDIEVHLPPDFPEKYADAVINAAELCTVKKHLQDPPDFTVTTKKQ